MRRVIKVRRRFYVGIGVLLLLGAVGVWYFTKRTLPPSGGLYFPWRVELAVPTFFQQDDKWSDDQLAWTDGTLGHQGCAVTSTAMVLRFYGVDTDPKRLNGYLSATGGYTNEGWICWEAAAWLAPRRVRFAYEDDASYYLLDLNLLRGNPVIVRLRLSNGITHFVVIAGNHHF